MSIRIILLDDEVDVIEQFSIPSACHAKLTEFIDSLASLSGERVESSCPAVRPGRPGMPVVVTAVDAAATLKFKIRPGDSFPSAVALSNKLGFDFSAVGQALGKSARDQGRDAQAAWDREGFPGKHTSRIRPQATIRGVTFMYEKDLPG